MSINFDFTTNNEPLIGSLLISNPMLSDRMFQRSVILICDHTDKGTVGFIVNKLSLTDVSESVAELDQLDIKLHYGGPLDINGINTIHKNVDIDNKLHIKDDLYYSGNIYQLPSLNNIKRLSLNDIKFFLGYSSWIPNQLKFEIQNKSWIVINDYNSDFIFNTPANDMWDEALKLMGHQYKAFRNFPIDPSFN